MRRAARVDENQADLVGLWRSVGVDVQTLHTVGKGCPDVLLSLDGLTLIGDFDREKVIDALMNLKTPPIIYNGANLPVEIKSSSKAKLTEDEKEWWGHRGRSYGQDQFIVSSEEEALLLVGRVFE